MEKFNSVLFIDDDPISNYIGKQLVSRLKLSNHVQSVFNGKQALQFLKNTDAFPDIIFLDLNMPLMNGYDFIKAFKETNHGNREVNIVVLTSSEDDRDLDKVQSFGIRYYLSKPLVEQNLMKICEIIKLNLKLKFVMLAS